MIEGQDKILTRERWEKCQELGSQVQEGNMFVAQLQNVMPCPTLLNVTLVGLSELPGFVIIYRLARQPTDKKLNSQVSSLSWKMSTAMLYKGAADLDGDYRSTGHQLRMFNSHCCHVYMAISLRFQLRGAVVPSICHIRLGCFPHLHNLESSSASVRHGAALDAICSLQLHEGILFQLGITIICNRLRRLATNEAG
ncbi:hypothetical protein GOP47_0027795 [Adiantum capillus-veneris]|nr:hypothetical protein GOP47_0027795 [Adiantum capillus-veneris]